MLQRSGLALIAFLLVLPAIGAGVAQAQPAAGGGEEEEAPLIDVAPVKPPDFYFGLLSKARAARGNGEPRRAFIMLAQVLSEGSDIEPYFLESEYELALALFDMGLFHSALTYVEKIVERGDSHPRYRDTLQWLVRLQRRIPGNVSLLERISAYAPALYPEGMVDEINYLAGRHYYNELDLDKALDKLGQVRKKNGAAYVRARYLAGVIHVQERRAHEAEKAFKDVLRYFLAEGRPEGDVLRFRDLSVMALARMFFTVGNHAAAERFYLRIPQSSESWLDAVYELSWTYFHTGDFSRAMGNLWTLDSPYFEDQYFPEGKLLQATILYASCNFREVIGLVNHVVPEFQRLKKEVKSILARTEDPNDFYFYLARLAATESSKLSLEVRQLFNAALSSRRMGRYFDLILQLNVEIGRMAELEKLTIAKDVVRRLRQDLTAFRELMIGEAGDLARQRLDRVRKDVSTMLSDALRLKFETIRKMRRSLAKKGTKAAGDGGRAERIEADDDHVLYDFDGEYWRDELGSYLYRVRQRCPGK